MKDKLIRVIKEELWSVLQWSMLFIPGRGGHYLRGLILSQFFEYSGGKFSIKENVEIYRPQNLKVGRGSGFGRNNIIDCTAGVIIGDKVRFGPNVMVATMNHATVGKIPGSTDKILKSVVIGNNCWIGGGVSILPGVTIGNNCIIAAGAVVTKDVSDNSTVAGIPAKMLES